MLNVLAVYVTEMGGMSYSLTAVITIFFTKLPLLNRFIIPTKAHFTWATEMIRAALTRSCRGITALDRNWAPLRVATTSSGAVSDRSLSSISRASLPMYKESIDNPSSFWGKAAQDISWNEPYTSVLDISPNDGTGKWFSGGKLNTSYNCLDRHIEAGHGDRTALIYDSPVTDTIRAITYKELYSEVVALSSVLKHKYGLVKGDRVIVYMPNIPQAAVSMLACARLGVVHSVVFGGFAAAELATRIRDCQPKLILAASCGIDGAKIIDYKSLLDSAIDIAASHGFTVKHCLMYQRQQLVAPMRVGRDADWETEVRRILPNLDASYEPVEASHPLYVLYTSGTTGSPKGVVRDNGGHAVAVRWASEHFYGLKPHDVLWASSDVGWVVGHSFMLYGPLLYGCTSLLYEGKPVGTPDAANFWRVIERHRVSALFSAPTAIRAIRREDENAQKVKEFDTSSLRTIFVAGERADTATLKWAEDAFDGKVPVRDHWWQTETGWPICGNIIGIDGPLPVQYGSSYTPLPGYDVNILDDENRVLPANTIGNIAVKLPLPPGTLLTLYNADDRFHKSYLEKIPGYYDTGDAGMKDAEGNVYIMSRTDDVMNVAGHRLSSGAMEEVLSDLPDVAEVAVIGVRDTFKGHLPLGLLVLNSKCTRSHKDILADAIAIVRERIGAVASFKQAVIVNKLPKTRSGKILRATMRSIANGEKYKLPATIEDVSVLEEVEKIIRSKEDVE